MSAFLTNTLITVFGLLSLGVLSVLTWVVMKELAWLHKRITDLEVAETIRKGREIEHCSNTHSP